MGAQLAISTMATNPLDLIERLAERRDWSMDRTTDSEVTLVVEGKWSDLYLSLNWNDDMEALLVACTFDAKAPQLRKDEVGRLTNLINRQLFHGHFDIWEGDGSIVFRTSIILSGGAVANASQCDTLVRLSVETCQRYYPTFQYVCWAGKSAKEALAGSMLETMGEA
jgi:hypothetical protein